MPLLNIDDSILQHRIYRMFQMEYALDLISQKRLVLVTPKLWNDPYENLLLKSFRHQYGLDTDRVTRWYGGNLFGICWTWIPESDFAWRVYVPKGRIGVIIESTVEKLLAAIHNWGGIFAMRDCFLGEVRYLPGREILDTITSEFFQRSNDSSDTAHMRATGLLLKRPEFEHEREVRAIIECSDKARIRNSNLVDVPIEPDIFIDEILIDPRIGGNDLDATRNRLLEAGYKGKMRQSELYRLPWEKSNAAFENKQ